MKLYLLSCILFICTLASYSQTTISGRIFSASDNSPLRVATLKLVGSNSTSKTDVMGKYTIMPTILDSIVEVSFVGFLTKSIKLIDLKQNADIYLLTDIKELNEVAVIATGYQKISNEKITGSFVVANNELLNRKVSLDIISRLDGVVPGMQFNRTGGRKINIRGQSTIFSNSEPLVVIDNFAYDGNINNINPNDVESVTVLKDAAAASIWGAKAANGVIVITTKQGSRNSLVSVNVNSNITIGERPNLFYKPTMSTSDFIETEKTLFANNFYRQAEISANKTPLTPVVELLIALRDKKISNVDAMRQIDDLKQYDIRNDYFKYLYRTSSSQQHSASLSGGGQNNSYYMSTGFDKNLENLKENSYTRFTIKASNTYNLLKDRITLSSEIYYTKTENQINNLGTVNFPMLGTPSLYPYARLMDSDGSYATTTKQYRTFVERDALDKGLLDWSYKPLEEIYLADNSTMSTDLRINMGLNVKLIKGLNGDIIYQYGEGTSKYRNFNSQKSWFTRNEINKITALNPNGYVNRPIPLGGILDTQDGQSASNNLRTQLNYNKSILALHELNLLAGYEVRMINSSSANNRLYGYNEALATSLPVDYITSFPLYVNPLSTATIPGNSKTKEFTDRYLSYYGNASYMFDKRYVFYASWRKDESNLFGVSTNQKGVPLWSVGTAYNISNEKFYKLNWLPYLKLKTSYGYNGNVNKSISAYTTTMYIDGGSTLTRLPYSDIVNPPNSELRWERVKNINVGVDFGIKNNILVGTVEYYRKKGLDLIGNTPYMASSGVTTFTQNYANTKSEGIDLQISSRNFDRKFKWFTTYMLSSVSEKVTHYLVNGAGSDYIYSPDAYPIVGKPLNAIYSFPYAGLDPLTGNPQGYLDGKISQDYAKIIEGTTPYNLIYNGSSRPTLYGSLINTFQWGNISVSANIGYRMGYYFRRNSVSYYGVLGGVGGHGDYGKRWQKLGDEKFTNIPSLPVSRDALRDNLYLNSSDLVEKGDHIRLQDINVGYNISKAQVASLPFKSALFYLYLNNLGILWKSSKANLDPDYPMADFTPPRTAAVGLKVNF